MFDTFPWVLAALGGVFIILVVAIFYVAKKRTGTDKPMFSEIHKTAFLTQFILGLAFSISGAFLMFNGEILGDDTTGIAKIFGIVGIALIATATPLGIAVKKKL